MILRNIRRGSLKVILNKMSTEKSVENTIRVKLNDKLSPTHMEIINESYMHNVKPGSETHFKLVVISEHFSHIPNIKRHQIIYKLLSDELKNGVHALSIVAKSPDEWDVSDKNIGPSPNCRGGFGK